ncbi:hypothetical protein K435DRAFT_845770 [Dendrothele bispora CBS 962.96]|uniref:Uncharacterized protein n=1 Tax=Dendrothele bispora (strain CBS 962.96) TaxID=1314807 RepID=A0A4V4HB91_DENBC|nr:hypothetical protein K435DRAFT_845770 [Dendrothele bispora CBS 962.96]
MPREISSTVASRTTRSSARSAGPAQLVNTTILSRSKVLPTRTVHAPSNLLSKRLNEPEREWRLYHDKCVAAVGPVNVRCLGCERLLFLDRRQTYYSGPWLKHKKSCSQLRAKSGLAQKERTTMPQIPEDIRQILRSGSTADIQAILGPLKAQKPYLQPDNKLDQTTTRTPVKPRPTSSISTQSSSRVEERPSLRIILPARNSVSASAPVSRSTSFPPLSASSSSSSSSPSPLFISSSLTSSSSFPPSPPSPPSALSASSSLTVHHELWTMAHCGWEGSLAERVHFFNGFAPAMKSRDTGLEIVGECSAFPDSFERTRAVDPYISRGISRDDESKVDDLYTAFGIDQRI